MKIHIHYLKMFHLRLDQWKIARTLKIQSGPTETILTLKRKIQEASADFPVEGQILSIPHHGELEDDKTLADYNIDYSKQYREIFLRMKRLN